MFINTSFESLSVSNSALARRYIRNTKLIYITQTLPFSGRPCASNKIVYSTKKVFQYTTNTAKTDEFSVCPKTVYALHNL